MKFDMHCHTKEGSFDSTVPLSEYIRKYKMLGYDGFMITDHNSYRACRRLHKIQELPRYDNFTILCGIEYDTKDAGHVLVMLPDGVYPKLLHIRGMSLRKLIRFVHGAGGILGLAHPFGVPSSSAMGFKLMNPNLLKNLDFVESFNTCENNLSNALAAELAKKYNLPGFGGTDAHFGKYIGMACTEINAEIHSNNDFIRAIKTGASVCAYGIERQTTGKSKVKDRWIGVMGYRLYNRGLSKCRMPQRKIMHKRHLHKFN